MVNWFIELWDGFPFYLQYLLQTTGFIMLLVLPLLIAIAFIVYGERKIWAAMQMRRGPNVVGPFGPLRAAMAVDLPELKAGDEFLNAPWGKFGKEGKIQAAKLTLALGNFYFTNQVARASNILLECSEARGFSKPERKTGTHG